MAGGVIIAVTGSNPFKAYYALLQGGGLAPKSSYASYKSMLTDFMSYVNYFTPMIYAALAVAVALRAGLFNIGVSGQMLAAGFTASIVVGYSSLNAVLAKPRGSNHWPDRRWSGGGTDRLPRNTGLISMRSFPLLC